jgi:hypothetical protein
MHNPLLVRRTHTHIIDTKAVRKVVAVLPEWWILRNMEERDYGIDLMLEVFEEALGTPKPEHRPTGSIIFGQVKGQQEKFNKAATLYDVPVKTLLYAELFPNPFLLLFVSLDTNEVRFVWVQQYILTVLNVERPDWREGTGGPINIDFPATNVLANGYQRITDFVLKYRDREIALQFLVAYEWMKFHLDMARYGDIAGAQTAFQYLKRLRRLSDFMARHRGGDSHIDLDAIQQHLQDIQSGTVLFDQVGSEIDEQLAELEEFKRWVLGAEMLDELMAEISTEPPY